MNCALLLSATLFVAHLEASNGDGQPLKQPARVYQSHHFDSTVWEQFAPRPDDIFVMTAYKSGSTWVQQILATLIFQGKEPPGDVASISPWVDLRVPPREVKMPEIEVQTHRRFLKSHLPADAMPYWDNGQKYIYVGRDGRDAFMSLCQHYETADKVWYDALNESPNLVGPKIPDWSEVAGPAALFDKWLSQGWDSLPWETDGWPWWSLFHNVGSWWEHSDRENILFVHFNNLKDDLPGEMRRIASFLDIPVDEEKFVEWVHKCSFEYMKTSGSSSFVNKGTNGRWEGVLSTAQLQKYSEVVNERLPADAARWLETGQTHGVEGTISYTDHHNLHDEEL